MSILKAGIRARQSLVGDQLRRGLVGVPMFGPTPTEAPSISGTTAVTETLTVDPGLWEGMGTVVIAYQWLRDGAPIGGAQGGTYTLVAADEGTSIDCRVTASDDNGSTARLAGAVGPIAAEPMPAATGGTITDITDPDDGLPYTASTFLSDGSFEVTEGGDFEYLIIGGGASGAATGDPRTGNGGGASGTVRHGTITLAPGTYPVVVGEGGLGVVPAAFADELQGNAGGASSALGVSAPGGNGGLPGVGNASNSGDGGSNADYAGGAGGASDDEGGGGAGSSGPGQDGAGTGGPGDGGAGTASTISGTAKTYGGGAGGSARAGAQGAGTDNGTDGANGTSSLAAAANSGGGTGGASVNATNNPGEGSGDAGSGIVIIRWRRAA